MSCALIASLFTENFSVFIRLDWTSAGSGIDFAPAIPYRLPSQLSLCLSAEGSRQYLSAARLDGVWNVDEVASSVVDNIKDQNILHPFPDYR